MITPLLRVVFMGTPSFAVPSLLALAKAHDVVAVYTRPDAVSGRGGRLSPSPVKQASAELGIEVFQPATLKDAAVVEELTRLQPDVIVVAAFGMILPQAILDIPALGCLNVHASVLPRWRGAAPIQRAILAGDPVAGVSIMRMEEGLDTGPYCQVATLKIEALTAGEVTERLADLGACVLLDALEDVGSGTCAWERQDDAQATYAPKIEKGDVDSSPSSQPRTPGVGFARRLHRRPPDCRWTVERSPFSLRPLRTRPRLPGAWRSPEGISSPASPTVPCPFFAYVRRAARTCLAPTGRAALGSKTARRGIAPHERLSSAYCGT